MTRLVVFVAALCALEAETGASAVQADAIARMTTRLEADCTSKHFSGAVDARFIPGWG